MELENQVCSLELSKRLRELGVKQESLFYWQDKLFPKFTDRYELLSVKDVCKNETLRYSAFTVAELGEMLLSCDYSLPWWNGLNCWEFETDIDCLPGGETEAEARARMLIYLIENNIIQI